MDDTPVWDTEDEDLVSEALSYDLYDEYYDSCERCSGTCFKGQTLCQTCREEDEALELLDYAGTRGQRRERERERDRRGMVKHTAPNVRPKRGPKPHVTVKG